MNATSDQVVPRTRSRAHGAAQGQDPAYDPWPEACPVPPVEQVARTAELDRLRAEVAGLRRAMETRPLIDQARGMVMALGPCSAETAWQVLVEVSQHTNIKLREVAAALTATTEGAALPAPVERSLAAALRRRRSTRR